MTIWSYYNLFSVSSRMFWNKHMRLRHKLTHAICRSSQSRQAHLEVCLCFSAQRPAARHLWQGCPSKCRHDLWPPWHTPPDRVALKIKYFIYDLARLNRSISFVYIWLVYNITVRRLLTHTQYKRKLECPEHYHNFTNSYQYLCSLYCVSTHLQI